MPTLHRYLLRQVIATCGLTVATFTALLLLGNVLKDVFDLVATGSISMQTAGYAVLLLIPFALAFALPIGLLTASLLVFGRLSADQELTAIRAGGISVVAACAPVLGLAVVLTGVSAALNMVISPYCREQFHELKNEVIRRGPAAFIGEGRYVDLGPLTLYAREVKGFHLRDVLIYGTTNVVADGRTNLIRNLDVWAPEGEVLVDTNGLPVMLRLVNLQGLILIAGDWQSVFDAERLQPINNFRSSGRERPKPVNMSFRELLEELQFRRGAGGALEPVRVHIHRQLAFSFSCLAFTLVGIPLGIRVHRRETNFGVAVALILIGAYYSFIILAQSLETRPQFHPHLILWVPNLVFLVTGVWLLRRAERAA
ncbi:MAG TPA: LptF/LptG family permease [Verrucomicrobiota bacterium]|nr:hypothetical protein [Verrucomicrobiales bacterium]HRI13854.1 LptF/LptG family permease [Verrucomicrobiota bacterium]